MEASRWTIRASWQGNFQSSVYARNNSFAVERQLSFREADTFPCALEYLLGGLAGDLIAGFEVQANRWQINIDAIEVSLSGWLNNPLIALGVVGEIEGHAGLQRIEGRIYISSEVEEQQLQKLWEEVQWRSPILQTLKRSVDFNLELKLAL